MTATHLLDKSAFARLRHVAVADVLAPLLVAGRVACCGILRLEVGYSARNLASYDDDAANFDAYPKADIESVDWDRAAEVHRELCARGEHRGASLPDLLLAACAQRLGLTVLHYDRDYETIAKVTGQPVQWVVSPGSVP